LVVLESVIDENFNRCCDDLAPGNCDAFIASDDFTQQVLLHPQVAGVARALLGEDFLVPRGGHHHFFKEQHLGQTWHSDGLSGSGYDVFELQCYYYPHSVELADGPTMVLPGSHCRAVDREAIAHYGDILGQVSLTVPAGTVVLTRYGIWHKAGPKTNDRARSMIKFSYHRTAAPQRDWLCDAAEIPAYHDAAHHPDLPAKEVRNDDELAVPGAERMDDSVGERDREAQEERAEVVAPFDGAHVRRDLGVRAALEVDDVPGERRERAGVLLDDLHRRCLGRGLRHRGRRGEDERQQPGGRRHEQCGHARDSPASGPIDRHGFILRT